MASRFGSKSPPRDGSDAVFVEGGQAYVYVVKPDSVVTRVPVALGTRVRALV